MEKEVCYIIKSYGPEVEVSDFKGTNSHRKSAIKRASIFNTAFPKHVRNVYGIFPQ